MDEGQFYTYKDGRKLELCKKCLTMHIDNFNPDTFLWALKKIDVPYIPQEWNSLRDKAFARDPLKMNGMSVFGKYLSKMKLTQWQDKSWADTEKILEELKQKEQERKAQKEENDKILKEQYTQGLISEAEYQTLASTETQNKELVSPDPIGETNMYNEKNFISEEELDLAKDLTEDDKKRLLLKWGRLYTPNEWITLENDYQQMSNSFDIQDADTINTLCLLCKTNLKANQAIDNGDIDGFQKLARVQESLRKSAKFTAAQNKEEKNNFVDSVGELVAMCERDGGFIPRFVTDVPQDVVDVTLNDMNNYLNKLVTQDLGFGQQIEDSLKKIQLQKEMNEAMSEDDNSIEEENIELEDEDYMAFYEEMNKLKEADEE
jgi:hypothetical protein